MKTQNQAARDFFRSFYRGNRLLWTATMVLMVLSALVNPAISWLLKEAIDVMYTKDAAYLLYLVKLGLCLLAAFLVTYLLADWLRGHFLRRAIRQYKAYAFEQLSRKSISAFSNENTARYISVLTNDIQTVQTDYLSNTFAIVRWIPQIIASCIMIFWYGGSLAWICIGCSLIPVVLSVAMGGEMGRRTQAVSDENEHFVARVKDLLNGFGVLKSFKAEKEAGQLFAKSNDRTEWAKNRQRWWNNLLGVMQDACSLILQFGVVFAGGYLAIQGKMTAGTAVVMVNLCGQLVGPISSLPQYLTARKAAAGLVRKLAGVVAENAAQQGEAIPPVLQEAITLEDLTFGYEENKPVLRNIHLKLEAGKRCAIVGASGSGKSTLLNLLMGAYSSYTGSISIDGRELRTVDPDSLYDLVSLIGQNVFLFDDTIRSNITMFRSFPDTDVESAAARSGLQQVIAQKGEDYRCGENGNGLSGGERQRVSIARSLLRKTPVLMLDEATAALDNQTAFEVTDAILRLEGLTRIVVTHRLEEALLRQYDQIIVLRDGTVAEEGTFESLMAKPGYFYSLYHVANGN